MPAPRVAQKTRLPVVVVAGRPNVGKSTLVNRFVGRRAAVVEERPGVTRDRLELEADWNGRRFLLVDTGGWQAAGDELSGKVSYQAKRAVEGADLVLVVVDVTVGVTTDDEDIARMVKRAGVQAVLVANKVDNERRESEAWELLSLGLGDPFMVSALHGRLTGELLDAVWARLEPWYAGKDRQPDDRSGGPEIELAPWSAEFGEERQTSNDRPPFSTPSEAASPTLRVAIAGRPNVGKSTLFNRIVGEDRSVVHDVPGTTRDSIDTVFETSDGPVRFVDTAGMRRRSRSAPGTEYFAMVRTLQAIDEADIVLLVVDATEGVTHQDQRLAQRIIASGSPVVVILNKWELLPSTSRADVVAGLEDRLGFLGDAPAIKVSALTGLGVHKILGAVRGAVDAYRKRVPTAELNRLIASIQAAHPAPGSRIRYAVQGATDPPTFTLFATKRLPATYIRYVERRLREEFDIGPTPLKLRVRLGS